MRRDVFKYPAPILRKVASPVEKVDDDIRSLLNDMAETMYAEDGVGIAAPQVGVSLRVAVIDTGGAEEGNPGLIKMVNPEIVSREGEIDWEEGCLSVPDFRVKMKRSESLVVRYLDENGNEKELAANGLLAVAVQQEIDHLDGKLILDAAGRIKRDIYTRKLKKQTR